MNKKRIIIVIALLYIVLITILSTINLSGKIEPVEGGQLDKVVHFCFYFLMNGLLILVTMIYRRSKKIGLLLLATLTSILYSIGIEVVQIFVGRHFDLLDIAANSIGAIAALLATQLTAVKRYISRKLEI